MFSNIHVTHIMYNTLYMLLCVYYILDKDNSFMCNFYMVNMLYCDFENRNTQQYVQTLSIIYLYPKL